MISIHAEAIAVLFEINKELNRAVKEENADQAAVYYSTLRHLTNILGLVQYNVDEFLKSDIGQEALGLTEEQIEDLIQQRKDAKKAKEFAQADEIRQSLLDQGCCAGRYPSRYNLASCSLNRQIKL